MTDDELAKKWVREVLEENRLLDLEQEALETEVEEFWKNPRGVDIMPWVCGRV